MAKLRVLLIGCGDVALRTARLLSPNFRLYGLTRNPEQHAALRAAGITPIPGDLDRLRTLKRLSVDPYAVLHFAPPPGSGTDDLRSRHLVAALAAAPASETGRRRRRGARSLPRVLVYISTTGVYGDCSGRLVAETAPAAPTTPRAVRRVAAEGRLRDFGRRTSVRVAILRAPGIYAEDRLPVERLQRGMPALIDDDDVYTNHVHADDLARATVDAMLRGKPQRAYNASDDAHWKMGEYFDRVADALGLARPPRISAIEADRVIAPTMRSFMSESRRLVNKRAKRELRWGLRHPTPQSMLDRMREGRVVAHARQRSLDTPGSR